MSEWKNAPQRLFKFAVTIFSFFLIKNDFAIIFFSIFNSRIYPTKRWRLHLMFINKNIRKYDFYMLLRPSSWIESKVSSTGVEFQVVFNNWLCASLCIHSLFQESKKKLMFLLLTSVSESEEFFSWIFFILGISFKSKKRILHVWN